MKNKRGYTIFIVDDDEMFLRTLEHDLTNKLEYRINLKIFATGEECLKNMYMDPDIVILDYYLSSKNGDAMNGLQVLTNIKERNSAIHVIMLSGQEKLEVASNALKHGAFDYVIKNESAFIRIKQVIINAIHSIKLRREARSNKIQFVTFMVVFIVLIVSFIISYACFPEIFNL